MITRNCILPAALALLLTAAVRAVSGDELVSLAPPAETIVSPHAAVLSDLDRDGRNDLVVATAGSWSLWLRGRADGSFGPPNRVPAIRQISGHRLLFDSPPTDEGGSESDPASRLLTTFLARSDGGFDAGRSSISLRFARPTSPRPLDLESAPLALRPVPLGDASLGLDAAEYRIGGGVLTTAPGRVVRFGDLNGDGRADLVLASAAPQSQIPSERSDAPTPTASGQASLRLGLRAPGPRPVGPNLPIVLTLPAPGEAAVEVHDVRGRLLLRRHLTGLGPGTHRIELGNGLALGSGIYLVRLTQGRAAVSTKVALVAP